MIFRVVVLSPEDDKFVREIDINSNETLFAFHTVLQDSLGYVDSLPASFFLANAHWERLEEFVLPEFETPNTELMTDVTLEELINSPKDDRLIYLFDNFNNRGLYIEVIHSYKDSIKAPVEVLSEGDAPPQVKDFGETNGAPFIKRANSFGAEDKTESLSNFDDDVGFNNDLKEDEEENFR